MCGFIKKIVYLIVTEKFQIWYGNRFSQHLSSFFFIFMNEFVSQTTR